MVVPCCSRRSYIVGLLQSVQSHQYINIIAKAGGSLVYTLSFDDLGVYVYINIYTKF